MFFFIITNSSLMPCITHTTKIWTVFDASVIANVLHLFWWVLLHHRLRLLHHTQFHWRVSDHSVALAASCSSDGSGVAFPPCTMHHLAVFKNVLSISAKRRILSRLERTKSLHWCPKSLNIYSISQRTTQGDDKSFQVDIVAYHFFTYWLKHPLCVLIVQGTRIVGYPKCDLHRNIMARHIGRWSWASILSTKAIHTYLAQ